jgi:hypothetical protein
MPIAFKEWAVTVRALAEGEQLVTLRKGGIREPQKHFKLDHERFFLYPTFDHQRTDLVRESHRPELSRALEEGVWSDGEPHPQALRRGEALAQPDRVRIRAWAEVAAHFTITDRRAVEALSPFYVWTPDYAEKRLAWKRRHPLHVILLRTYRIPRPVTVKVREEYGGCRSWLELTRDLPFEGTPVLSDEEFERASEAIAAIASDRQPDGPARPGGPTCLSTMPWEQSTSASFTARHDSAQTADAQRVLSSLEHVRVQLQQAFEHLPGETTVILHARASELALSNPLLLGAWAISDPTARRYVCGWAGVREIHVLSPAALRDRAAPVTGSREMLRLSAAALYCRRVIEENQAGGPRRFGPSRPLVIVRRELRWAWLLEGAARWLAGQTAHARPAIARRLREGRRPAFPPSVRDAPLLGGTVCDLLAGAEGEAAVTALARRRPAGDPRAVIERAFGARLINIDAEWRTHLAAMATADR